MRRSDEKLLCLIFSVLVTPVALATTDDIDPCPLVDGRYTSDVAGSNPDITRFEFCTSEGATGLSWSYLWRFQTLLVKQRMPVFSIGM